MSVRNKILMQGLGRTADHLCLVLLDVFPTTTVLMYIHRSFFAQAIIEQPDNPLKSTYAPSFLAAFRASTTILKSVRDQFDAMPGSCARHWAMWTFAFSAAVSEPFSPSPCFSSSV
jgi:hypothetical protein